MRDIRPNYRIYRADDRRRQDESKGHIRGNKKFSKNNIQTGRRSPHQDRQRQRHYSRSPPKRSPESQGAQQVRSRVRDRTISHDSKEDQSDLRNVLARLTPEIEQKEENKINHIENFTNKNDEQIEKQTSPREIHQNRLRSESDERRAKQEQFNQNKHFNEKNNQRVENHRNNELLQEKNGNQDDRIKRDLRKELKKDDQIQRDDFSDKYYKESQKNRRGPSPPEKRSPGRDARPHYREQQTRHGFKDRHRTDNHYYRDQDRSNRDKRTRRDDNRRRDFDYDNKNRKQDDYGRRDDRDLKNRDDHGHQRLDEELRKFQGKN